MLTRRQPSYVLNQANPNQRVRPLISTSVAPDHLKNCSFRGRPRSCGKGQDGGNEIHLPAFADEKTEKREESVENQGEFRVHQVEFECLLFLGRLGFVSVGFQTIGCGLLCS